MAGTGSPGKWSQVFEKHLGNAHVMVLGAVLSWALMILVGPFQVRIVHDSMIYKDLYTFYILVI